MTRIMKISFADLHKALQYAEDWYWDDIETVLNYFPDENEVTLTPDCFGFEISNLIQTLAEQLGRMDGADLRARASTSQTYWGPRITVSRIEVTDIPANLYV